MSGAEQHPKSSCPRHNQTPTLTIQKQRQTLKLNFLNATMPKHLSMKSRHHCTMVMVYMDKSSLFSYQRYQNTHTYI